MDMGMDIDHVFETIQVSACKLRCCIDRLRQTLDLLSGRESISQRETVERRVACEPSLGNLAACSTEVRGLRKCKMQHLTIDWVKRSGMEDDVDDDDNQHWAFVEDLPGVPYT